MVKLIFALVMSSSQIVLAAGKQCDQNESMGRIFRNLASTACLGVKVERWKAVGCGAGVFLGGVYLGDVRHTGSWGSDGPKKGILGIKERLKYRKLLHKINNDLLKSGVNLKTYKHSTPREKWNNTTKRKVGIHYQARSYLSNFGVVDKYTLSDGRVSMSFPLNDSEARGAMRRVAGALGPAVRLLGLSTIGFGVLDIALSSSPTACSELKDRYMARDANNSCKPVHTVNQNVMNFLDLDEKEQDKIFKETPGLCEYYARLSKNMEDQLRRKILPTSMKVTRCDPKSNNPSEMEFVWSKGHTSKVKISKLGNVSIDSDMYPGRTFNLNIAKSGKDSVLNKVSVTRPGFAPQNFSPEVSPSKLSADEYKNSMKLAAQHKLMIDLMNQKDQGTCKVAPNNGVETQEGAEAFNSDS